MTKTQAPLVDYRKLKERVTIVDILDRLGLDLKKQGESLVGSCPLCGGSENTRKFQVTPSKGVHGAWQCFGCEEHGNGLDLVAKIEDIPIRQSAQLIAKWFDVTDCFIEKKSGSQRTEKAKKPSSGKKTPNKRTPPEGASASDYDDSLDGREGGDKSSSEIRHNPALTWPGLKNLEPEHDDIVTLGLMPDTVAYFDAGICSKGLMADRLAIPIHNREGELLGYAGIDVDQPDPREDLLTASGTEKKDRKGRIQWPPEDKYEQGIDLFNLHRAVASTSYEVEGLVIVRDFIEVLDQYEHGHENAIALMGDELTEQQALRIEALDRPLPFFTLWMSSQHPECANIVARLSQIGYVRLVTPKEREYFNE